MRAFLLGICLSGIFAVVVVSINHTAMPPKLRKVQLQKLRVAKQQARVGPMANSEFYACPDNDCTSSDEEETNCPPRPETPNYDCSSDDEWAQFFDAQSELAEPQDDLLPKHNACAAVRPWRVCPWRCCVATHDAVSAPWMLTAPWTATSS